ncbi:hypothetical protein MIND_01126500 [Mycena indigotica]|uniref:Uncharacterized protein n=1 Tax=Mycena indigotica TaxID=2126181 RepID=A0A8H6S7F9_9AGAR|nr:uncharacterized protein MIND_01126500 [Mycena indigotica]KAF7293486.1 hypothetical protein MIND_01126500 [Mycena indigotica]
MCNIHGVRIPNSTNNTLYVPLDRSKHPDVHDDMITTYDPHNLPLRTQEEFMAQATAVDNACTKTDAENLARQYGIKGTAILSRLNSLKFPYSFPYDFMHLIWENLIPNLILLWTNKFKGLDEGLEHYSIDSALWAAIGKDTAKAGGTIPSVFGTRVPDLAKGGFPISAEMHSIWVQFIGPTLLRRAFTHVKYYDHFILLVQILNKCLAFEIGRDKIDWLGEKIPEWVQTYEKSIITLFYLFF